MNKRCFIDSNLWIYAAIADGSEKSERARKLIENEEVVISTQVINEVSFNLLRKYRYTEAEITVFIRQISVVPTSQWRYVLTAVVYDASLIHPTATAYRQRFLNLAGAKFPKPLRFRKL